MCGPYNSVEDQYEIIPPYKESPPVGTTRKSSCDREAWIYHCQNAPPCISAVAIVKWSFSDVQWRRSGVTTPPYDVATS